MTRPIWLVVGFLGAGKTTVLRRLVHHAQGRALVFVVNEFSAVDVDAGLIEREGGTAIAVAGGSIFCRCLVTEFIRTLTSIAEGVVCPDGSILQPEGVVIEASGMADPRSMARMLAESGLDARYHLAGVTAVVDPGTLMKLLLVLPNIRGQIESADLILLNKIDLHAPETVERVRQKLVAINPRATVIRCTQGRVAPEILLADGTRSRIGRIDAEYGLCKDPNFERETILFSRPIAVEQVRAIFAEAGEGFYRAKGAILTSSGWMQLDWSGGRLALEPCPAAPQSALVLIWNPATGTVLTHRLRTLTTTSE